MTSHDVVSAVSARLDDAHGVSGCRMHRDTPFRLSGRFARGQALSSCCSTTPQAAGFQSHGSHDLTHTNGHCCPAGCANLRSVAAVSYMTMQAG
jgi:hypothetical protein